MGHSAGKSHLSWLSREVFPSFVVEQKLVLDSSSWIIKITKHPQGLPYFLIGVFVVFVFPLSFDYGSGNSGKKELNSWS